MLDWIGKLVSARFYRNPIFVVGGGRSGTSVLVQALGQHSEIIAVPNEAVFLTTLGAAASDIDYERRQDASYYFGSLAAPFDYLLEGIRRMAFESIFGRHYGLRPVLSIVRSQRNLSRKRIWCAKTFPSQQVAQGLIVLYPETRFVYILRNGCDVVHSRTKFSGFRDLDFAKQCTTWAKAVEDFRFLVDSDKALQVRQEDLVKQPEEAVRRILEFIGVGPDPAPLRFLSTTLVHPLDNPDQQNVDVRKSLGDREPGYLSWSEEQKTLFKSLCGDAMHAAGYEIPF